MSYDNAVDAQDAADQDQLQEEAIAKAAEELGMSVEDFKAAQERTVLVTQMLQGMANSSDEGDVQSYFNYYQNLLKLFTPPEIAEKGGSIPPWGINDGNIQGILIHTMLGLILRTLNDAQVFAVAQRTRQMKNASGLVDATGHKIIGG